MARRPNESTEIGAIEKEERLLEHPYFTVISRTIRTPDGALREPQLIWDRHGRQSVIAVVTDSQGRYVLVKEPKFGQMVRMISAPTGGIRKDESIVDAAKREFRDETGYEGDCWRVEQGIVPLVDFADKTDGGQHIIVTARNARKVAEPKGAGQLALVLEPEVAFAYMLKGCVPAMSMAALLLIQQFRR